MRVIGSGHSFNNLTEPAFGVLTPLHPLRLSPLWCSGRSEHAHGSSPCTGGYVVNLHDKYKRVLAIEPLKERQYGHAGAPPVTAYATVQAGIRLKDLCAQLELQGYGVHNMGAPPSNISSNAIRFLWYLSSHEMLCRCCAGNYYEQTVGGVVATGTHGTTGAWPLIDSHASVPAKQRSVIRHAWAAECRCTLSECFTGVQQSAALTCTTTQYCRPVPGGHLYLHPGEGQGCQRAGQHRRAFWSGVHLVGSARDCLDHHTESDRHVLAEAPGSCMLLKPDACCSVLREGRGMHKTQVAVACGLSPNTMAQPHSQNVFLPYRSRLWMTS